MITVTGAAGDGRTDDSAAIQAAINQAAALGVAEVVIPPANNTWYYAHNLVLPASIVLRGPASLGTSQHDQTILTVTGPNARLEGLTLLGAGSLGPDFDQGNLPSKPAVVVNAPGGDNVTFRDCTISGGAVALDLVAGGDTYLEHTRVSHSYAAAALRVCSQVWAHRSFFDQNPAPYIDPIPGPPLAPWRAGTAYPAGALALIGDYIIACTTAGTTGATAPALRPYYSTIADGTAAWLLAGGVGWAMVQLDTGSAENFFSMCDLSGFCWFNIRISDTLGGPAPSKALNMAQCILSQSLQAAVSAEAGSGLTLVGCELFPGHLPGGSAIAYGSAWKGNPAQIVAPA